MKRHWAIWLLALLPLIPLWRAVFLGETIGAFDEIRPMAPWNAPASSRPWDVLQADSVLQFYGWRELVFESWGQGKPPLWNPYQLCGTPLLANSQSGGIYPPHILMGVLHIPTGIALTLLAWFHLFWAGLGTLRLARRLGATEVGGVLAGVSFSLSQFMLAWTALPSVISTCAWIPWLLLGVESFFRHPERSEAEDKDRCITPTAESKEEFGPSTPLRSAQDDGWRAKVNAALLVAISMAMMILAGHLQFAAYGMLAAAFLGIWRVIQLLVRRKGRNASVALGFGVSAVLVALVLAAPHLAAVRDYSKHSHRISTATEDGYKAYAAGGIPAISLVGLPNPALQGLPTQPAPEVDGASNYWPGFVHRGANFAETALGLSPLVVFLAIFGAFNWKRWSRAAPYIALTLLALLLALGTPLNRLLYFGLPGWSATGSPGRIAVLFVLGMCLLAGVAVPNKPPGKRVAILSASIFLLLAIAPFLVMRSFADSLLSWLPQVGQEIISKLITGAAGAATGPYFVALLLCLIVALFLSRDHQYKQPLIVTVACVLPITLFATQVIRTGTPLARIELGKPHQRIAVVNDSWDLLTAAPANLPPNTATMMRTHDVAGYDSLLHKETVALLHEIMGQDPAPPANGNIMFVKTSANPLKLADAGVTEIWTRRPLEKLGTLGREEEGLYKYPVHSDGRAYVEMPDGNREPAEIIAEPPNSIRIRAHGPGKLVVRDRAMEGWRYRIGERSGPVPTALWIEVPLESGEQVVELEYAPEGFGRLLGISGFLWLCVVVGLFLLRRAGLQRR